VPTVYALPDSEDEEEADRKVGTAEEAAGDESGSESGAPRPGSSALLTRKAQPAPSSTTNAEGPSKSTSASTSKPGTIFVKKEGGSSSTIPKTPAKQEHPKPRGTYRGARHATPPAANLFDDEARASSSKTTADHRLVYALSPQGRPPSEDLAELEKPSTKVVDFLLFHFIWPQIFPSAAVSILRNLLASLPKCALMRTLLLASRTSPTLATLVRLLVICFPAAC
jgi:hypothetical protein